MILSCPYFFIASASVNPTDPIGGFVKTTEGTVSKSTARSVFPLKSHSAKTLPARIATGVRAFEGVVSPIAKMPGTEVF